MVHLRREQYLSMPWRNGFGVTMEIAREPPVGGEFQWRLSLATVATSGPFSTYAGFRRSVTLIEGEGFRLDIGAQEPVVLESRGTTAMFPGEAPTHCTLINGPCIDLSLMVREPGWIISVIRLQDAVTVPVPLEAGAFNAVFCLAAGTLVTYPGGPTTGRATHTRINLALHDTALLDQQATAVSLAPSQDMPTAMLLLTWKTATSR
jgi:environmental stress-induced protein Ves